MFFTFHLRKKKSLIAVGLVLLLLITGITGATAAAKSQQKFEGTPLTIVMYHSIVKDSSKQGDYVITPQLLENDMKYLKDNGYTAIVIQDLLNYVQGGTPLPPKPVMLTFDDGYYNNYLYAYPLAQKYQMKLVISPIGYFTDQYTKSGEMHELYTHITWEQMKEMIDSGLVEIQNHSYHLHATADKGRLGTKKSPKESVQEYTSLLTKDLTQMQAEVKSNTGWTPTAFTYPFGIISKESLPVVRYLGFQASLSCDQKINDITQNSECLYLLGRYLRPAGKNSEQFFSGKLK